VGVFSEQRAFVADRTYATVLRPSVVCRRLSSVTLCIVTKLVTAYRKSYMRNRLVPKWITLTFV